MSGGSIRLTSKGLAVCPECNSIAELGVGELWPAFCHCGTQLRRATGIERKWWEEACEEAAAEVMSANFYERLSEYDRYWLKWQQIAI